MGVVKGWANSVKAVASGEVTEAVLNAGKSAENSEEINQKLDLIISMLKEIAEKQ